MPKSTCGVCDRPLTDAYMCRKCSNVLRDLLIGSPGVGGQPGIVWYVKRLRESAYGQTRLARSLSTKSTTTGYALLGNNQAAELLTRINVDLAYWEAQTEALAATQSHERGWEHTGSPTRDCERLESKRARFIAQHTALLRHHAPDIASLHRSMLDHAQRGWRIINRPNDVCCGPCPTVVDEIPCGTLLYADETDTVVQCPKCRSRHDVQRLRDDLKRHVSGMLFTRHELVTLMETRLNDRIPQPTFTKLLRDGRLRPRHIDDDGTALFTYDDVVAARRKPVPHSKIRAS